MDIPEKHVEAYFAFLENAALLESIVAGQLERDGGLTVVQFGLLGRLARDQPMRMSELADSVVHSPSGLTYQIRVLTERGLVARRRASDDERAVELTLTAEGTALFAEVLPGHRQVVQDAFFGALTSKQLDTLSDTLGILRTSLRKPAQG